MERIAEKVWKLNVDSNIYFLDLNEKIIIDAGPPGTRNLVEKELSKVVDLSKVDRVIFTHLHYDHIANFDLFPNAKFYTSEEEINFFENNKLHAILNPDIVSKFNIKLHVLKELEGFNIINTPGHTKGSFCLLYKKEGVLFSGDTMFFNGYGRIDFPGAEPSKMEESLGKLKKLEYKVLAPGHDY